MEDGLSKLFSEYDRGTMSRRQLFQALGVAAAGVALPMQLFSQGRCGGTNAGSAQCDTTPAKAPFEPTGWKTVYLDHFTLATADYKKEAAYYAALMNWKVRSDDGTQAILDIGDVGTVMIRGGYEAPPRPAPAAPPAGGDSAGRGGRGGRGGGGGFNRAPVNAVWDSFCWGIDQWDRNKVEAELKKRGLNPTLETDGKGFEAFRVTDPGGFAVKISNGNHRTRRQGNSTGNLGIAAPFASTNWHTVWLDHISFNCPSYKESAAFYEALLGWKPLGDEGSQNEMEIGELGNIIVRGGGPQGGRGGGAAPAQRRAAVIDHIAFGIDAFEPDAVKAELDKRGLTARPDTGGPKDIHDPTAKYKSYHTTTPNGWDLQISNANKGTRTVR